MRNETPSHRSCRAAAILLCAWALSVPGCTGYPLQAQQSTSADQGGGHSDQSTGDAEPQAGQAAPSNSPSASPTSAAPSTRPADSSAPAKPVPDATVPRTLTGQLFDKELLLRWGPPGGAGILAMVALIWAVLLEQRSRRALGEIRVQRTAAERRLESLLLASTPLTGSAAVPRTLPQQKATKPPGVLPRRLTLERGEGAVPGGLGEAPSESSESSLAEKRVPATASALSRATPAVRGPAPRSLEELPSQGSVLRASEPAPFPEASPAYLATSSAQVPPSPDAPMTPASAMPEPLAKAPEAVSEAVRPRDGGQMSAHWKTGDLLLDYGHARAMGMEGDDWFKANFHCLGLSCLNLNDHRLDPTAVLHLEPSDRGWFLGVDPLGLEIGQPGVEPALHFPDALLVVPALNRELLAGRSSLEGVFLYRDPLDDHAALERPAVARPSGAGWVLERPGEIGRG